MYVQMNGTSKNANCYVENVNGDRDSATETICFAGIELRRSFRFP